jgi:hypothetical protein
MTFFLLDLVSGEELVARSTVDGPAASRTNRNISAASVLWGAHHRSSLPTPPLPPESTLPACPPLHGEGDDTSGRRAAASPAPVTPDAPPHHRSGCCHPTPLTGTASRLALPGAATFPPAPHAEHLSCFFLTSHAFRPRFLPPAQSPVAHPVPHFHSQPPPGLRPSWEPPLPPTQGRARRSRPKLPRCALPFVAAAASQIRSSRRSVRPLRIPGCLAARGFRRRARRARSD